MGMSKRRLRTAGLSAATLALATAGALIPASPASARPADCSLTVNLIQAGSGGLNARANVYCTNAETYTVLVYLYRKDTLRNALVAWGKGDYNKHRGWGYAHANEPCSDVSTSKTYYARAVLKDTRFGPGIEVKDAKTGNIRGHC